MGFWNADSDRDWDDYVHEYDEPKTRVDDAPAVASARRWYCELCDAWFGRGGDCPKCGASLRRAA